MSLWRRLVAWWFAADRKPVSHYRVPQDHFDKWGQYIIKDPKIARAARYAKNLGATMTAVTFATPVTTTPTHTITSFTMAFTGVTSGQPIVIYVTSSGASPTLAPTFSDNFSTSYTYTFLGLTGQSGLSGRAQLYAVVATGGSGTSGTVTVAGLSSNSGWYYSGWGASAIGASTAAGIKCLDSWALTYAPSGSASGQCPPLVPATSNDGVIIAAFQNTASGSITVAPPSSPWGQTATATGGSVGGIATQSGPTINAAISAPWSFNDESGSTDDTTYATVMLLPLGQAPLTGPIGSLVTGAALATLAVSPYLAGDALVLFAINESNSEDLLTTVSGGGVGYWNRAVYLQGITSYSIEIWWGVVTTAGASTITVTNPNTTYTNQYLAVQEFRGAGTGTWTNDGLPVTQTGTAASWATTSLTPTTGTDIWISSAAGGFSLTGSLTNVVYPNIVGGDWGLATGLAYGAVTSATSNTWTQGSSLAYLSLAMLLTYQPNACAPVGEWVTNGSQTLAVTIANIGDLLVVAWGDTGDNGPLLSVSGGGVTTWIKAKAEFSAANYSAEIWYGVTTSTGSQTITATNTTSTYDTNSAIGAVEYTVASTGTWSLDGTNTNSGTATSGTFPSITPTGNFELYFAALSTLTSMTIGQGAGGVNLGFQSAIVNLTAERQGLIFTTSANNSVAQAPTWTAANHPYAGASAVFKFTPSSKGAPVQPKIPTSQAAHTASLQ